MAAPRTAGVRNMAQLQEIYRVIQESPGIYMPDLIRRLERPQNTVQSAVASLDLAGLLVSEHAGGALFPFRVISVEDSQLLWTQTRR